MWIQLRKEDFSLLDELFEPVVKLLIRLKSPFPHSFLGPTSSNIVCFHLIPRSEYTHSLTALQFQ
jgi:hypothetical protein